MWFYHFKCPRCKKVHVIPNTQSGVLCACGDGLVFLHMENKEKAELISPSAINLFPEKELIDIDKEEILQLWKIKFNSECKEYKEFMKMDGSKEYKDYAKARGLL